MSVQQAEVAQPSRLRRWAGRLAMAGALVAGSFGVEAAVDAATSDASSRPTCYGDYCSGQYANKTGCDKDAVTLLSEPLYQDVQSIGSIGADGGGAINHEKVKTGVLQVRGSKRCGTEWARAIIHKPTYITGISIVQDETGYSQTRNLQPNITKANTLNEITGTFFSPQIFTHNFNSQAVSHSKNGSGAENYNHWVAGLRNN